MSVDDSGDPGLVASIGNFGGTYHGTTNVRNGAHARLQEPAAKPDRNKQRPSASFCMTQENG